MLTTMYQILPYFYLSVSSSHSLTLLVFGHRAVTVVWLIYSFPDCSICRALMLFTNRLEGFESFCEGVLAGVFNINSCAKLMVNNFGPNFELLCIVG